MLIKPSTTQTALAYIDSQTPIFRFGLVVLAIAVAVIGTRYIPVIGERAAFLLFFFAIIQSSFWFGRNPGFFAIVLSIPTVNIEVLLPLWYSKPNDALILNTGFCVFAALIVATTSFHRKLQTSLWASRQDLNHAQAIGQVGNWRMNVQRNELLWSKENHRIFGIPEGMPMTYETFLNTVHPDDKGYVDQKWQAALQGEPYEVEHRIIVDGIVKWVYQRAELEFEKNGVLMGGFGTTQDITERKHSELELQESKQRYSGIVESAMDAIITIDANQNILVFNAAAEKMFGYTAVEAIGTSLERFVPKHFHDAHGKHIHAFGRDSITRRVMSTMGVVTGLRANGEEFPVEVAISHYELNNKKFFTAIIRDITERIRAESVLLEQIRLQDQLTKVAATVPGVICTFCLHPDGSSHMPYASPAFETLTGLSLDTVAKDFSPFFAGIHPDDLKSVNAVTAESARNLQPWRGSFRYDHPTEGEIWLESHSMPQHELDGSTLWHGYIQDITNRKRTELALIDRENELRLIMDATPALISYLDTDFRYLKVNKAYENWFCIPQERIVGQIAREIIGEKAWSFVQPYLERARAGKRVSFDYQVPYGTGKPRWVHGNYIPDTDPDGNVKGVVVHVIDIEDRKQAELERHKFVSLADNSQEFIGMCDMNFKPFYANEAGMKLVGLDGLKQTFQTPVWEFFFPEDQGFIMDEFFPRVFKEKRGEVEIRFRHFKTDAAIWMIYNVFYIQDDKGESIGLATVSRDITTRKLAEAAIRKKDEQIRLATEKHLQELLAYQAELKVQNEQLLQATVALETSRTHYHELYDFAPIAYLTLNPEGFIEEINLTGAKLFGLERNKLIHQRFEKFIIEEHKDRWHRYFMAAKQQSSRESIDLSLNRDDGVVLFAHLESEPRVMGNSYPVLRIALIDVTQRTLVENALRDSEARLALVIEEVRASYWDWNLNSGVIYSSPEWKRQIGFDEDELLNQSEEWESRLHPEDKDKVLTATKNYIAGHAPTLEFQYRIQHKDGSYRWIHSRGALLRDQQSIPNRMLGINLDITDYMKTKELNERRDEMEKSFRLYVASQTAAAIAHELNQPLTAISYYSYVAQNLLDTGNQKPLKLAQVIEKCGQQAQRAGDVIQQLLALLHKGETTIEPVDINKSIDYALDYVKVNGQLSTDYVKVNGQLSTFDIELNLAVDLPPVTSNAIQVQKVLVNLLNNGLESMKESGRKTGMMAITTCRAPNDPALMLASVCDSGTGAPDIDALSKMFQAFYTTKPTGLGMGLAVSRALIEAHGGKMWAEQNTDIGLTIHFTLPFVL